MKLYGIQEAAEYLGLQVVTVKKHIYQTKRLVPDANVGHSLVFTQETLDAFKANQRPGGRPRKEQPE